MVQQVITVRILDCLRDRLRRVSSQGDTFTGVIYGVEVEGRKIIMGAAGKEGMGDLELCNEMLPCGVEPIGVFGYGERVRAVKELISLGKQLPPVTQGDVRPLLMVVHTDGQLETALLGEDGVGPELEVGTISSEELSSLITLIRVRGKLEVNCGFTKTEVSNAFRHLIEKVSCPYGSFMLEGGRLAFLHKFLEKGPGRGWTSTVEHKEEEDCMIAGLDNKEEELTVAQIWDYTQEKEESDGFGDTGRKTKVSPRDRMEFTLVWNYSNPACSSRTIGCAPIMHREKKAGPTIRIPVTLDALGVISSSAPATQLMEVLKGAVGRQVGDIAAAVLSELKMKNSISAPQAFHFSPPGLGHNLTLVYTKAATTNTFEAFRRSVHTSFMLPVDRPLFRRANAISFPDKSENHKLKTVHLGLESKHGLVGDDVQVALVQGDYVYHHYMQDSFNDDGWGCAYRSLQTLISWFRIQGYTETEVPNHREVQKCLVDIGDKEAKFIGSKQWIGSTEVGFVLNTALNVESRFVSVGQGSDLGSKARELLLHFQGQGSPVMIGGGVYAHTILGVAWNQVNGDVAWLVLDPHYTGQEDLRTILSKGWCGWKGPQFWNQTAFYNMCLPQRPETGL